MASFKLTLPFVFIMLLSITFTLSKQPTAEDDNDQSIQNLSQFFIELISQYDTTGNGMISKTSYPFFLRDIFLKGSFGNQDEKYEHRDLLLKATQQFTTTKDPKEEVVNIQEIYEDIISSFTLFLMEKPEYKILIDTLFDDVRSKPQVAKSDDSEKNQQSDERLEL